ncbi:MAG: molybdenum cofactor guanylyltransferase, partial [Caldilineae bacterium]
RHEWVLVLACDMPFLDPRAIALLADRRPGADVVVPRITPQPETLHAFYRKTCLPAIHKRLTANRLKVIGFFGDVAVVYVSAGALQQVVPTLDFLINLNTPDDLARARQIVARRKGI